MSTTIAPPRHLSVVIPAHNEAGNLPHTLRSISAELKKERIVHEILVINDHSVDETAEVLRTLSLEIPELRWMSNDGPGGFGFAVRLGLENFNHDAVAVVMADCSDSPEDIVRFFRLLEGGAECAFGSRFMAGSKVIDYPWVKLWLNRLGNLGIQMLFQLRYNDMTNAFKMYRRHVIEGIKPFLSHHFNLTVELPLKAIVRGFSYEVIPNAWTNRKTGISKFKIREMGSRYLFILMYCFIEKWLVAGDYYRKDRQLVSHKRKTPVAIRHDTNAPL